MKKIHVLVSDDHPLTDRAVPLLSANPHIICLRIAQRHTQIQGVMRLRQPDVILVGVDDLLEDAETRILNIRKISPQSKVIVLVDHTCPLCMHRLIAQGSVGYIPRSEFVKRPVDVLSAVVQRGPWVASREFSRSKQTAFVTPPRIFTAVTL